MADLFLKYINIILEEHQCVDGVYLYQQFLNINQDLYVDISLAKPILDSLSTFSPNDKFSGHNGTELMFLLQAYLDALKSASRYEAHKIATLSKMG